MRPRIKNLETLEVFYSDIEDQEDHTCFWNHDTDEPTGTGYYYWFCFPGCLPESDPFGPFDTEAEAIEDAKDFHL